MIKQAQLNTLSQAGAWGDVGKPQQDMAIPFNSTKHHHEVQKGLWPGGSMGTFQPSLLPLSKEAGHKLVLLVDKSMDWAYAFVQLNDALSHIPLSNEGHVSAMTYCAPTVDVQGWLHQLQICKLLQHNDMVVCPEGLNSKLEALQCTFQELLFLECCHPQQTCP